MAKKSTAAKAAIDPAATYAVELVKLVRVGRLKLRPGARARLRGDRLAEVLEIAPEAVAAYAKA